MAIQVIIANSQAVERIGLTYMVHHWMPEAMVSYTREMQELMTILTDQRVDLWVMDIAIKGGDNLEVIRKIKKIQSGTRILIFTEYAESVYALRCLDAGADGYLLKTCGQDDVMTALDTVFEGRKYLSSNLKELRQLTKLTNREMEVCQLFLAGKRGYEIAREMVICPSTVCTYKKRIFTKLGVRSMPGLFDAFNVCT